MDKKVTETVNNICTILGGALLLYPLIDEATKTIIPKMEELASGEATEGMKLLPAEHEKAEQDKHERDSREKEKDNEIEELKRKLKELEEKEQEQSGS